LDGWTSGTIAVMAKERIEAGPAGKRVRENIAALRGKAQQSEISKRLAALGRPLSVSTLSKIEQGGRRLDPDDLVAISVALRVTPNRLLLPATAGDEPTELAPALEVSASSAWRWACGELPLPLQPWEPVEAGFLRLKAFRSANRPHDSADGMVSADDFVKHAPLLRPLLDAARQAAGEAGIPVDHAIKILELMTVIGPVEDAD